MGKVVTCSESGYSLICVGFVRGFLPKNSRVPELEEGQYVLVRPAPDSRPPVATKYVFEGMSSQEAYRRIVDAARSERRKCAGQ